MTRRVLDAVLDAAVVSFALWTLVYCVGLVTQMSLWLPGWLWLAASVAILAGLVLDALRTPDPEDAARRGGGGTARAADTAPERTGARGGDGMAMPTVALLATGLLATCVAAVAGAVWWPGSFAPVWLATMAALGALSLWSLLVGRFRLARPGWPVSGRRSPDAGVSGLADLGVVATALLCAVAALFIHLADTDDPYYLNRSVWVAERGNAALEDTMFSPEVFNSPYGGGIPIASVEALLGVVAHMLDVRAGTATYLVATPVATVLAVWATWRLVRRWAPRRAFLVFVAAIAFLMLSGDSMLGNFWVPRIWQGKVMAVVILMPLIWAYLTEVAETDDRRGSRRLMALLAAAGIAFFGLTPTAVVWAPFMLAAAVLAAVALRSGRLAVGAGLMTLGPLVSGAAVVVFSTDVGGAAPVALSSKASFVRILGETGPMVALGLVALCLAPLLARRGVPAALAAASAVVAVAVYTPGVPDLVNAVTGSGPILWRLLYVAPIPILAGLLASVSRPAATGDAGPAGVRRLAVVAPVMAGVVLLAGLAVGGRAVWWHTGHGGPVTVSSTPEWKLDLEALEDVEVLADRDVEGVVLLPPRRMKVLTMYTTDAFPVVPREWFIANIDEPRKSRRARRLLYDLAAARPPFPPQEEVRAALRRLDVELSCAGPSPYHDRVVRLMAGAGYEQVADVGSLTCLEPRAG